MTGRGDPLYRSRSSLNNSDTSHGFDPLSPMGLKASAMTSPQRDLLMKLIDVYTGVMTADIASERMEKLRKAGLENIALAWAGETERGKKHLYRIQGPTFLGRVRQLAERR